ncbi:MAG TPA: glycosyltransferase family 39 protein [Pyrinomonadaceae bacterium]|nr:glycosyltransferase family 39 protein [Pyrinomonadaceae bacterium]
MPEQQPPDAREDSFRRLLRAHRGLVLALLVAAFGLRLAFTFAAPHGASWNGDPRYYVTAFNLYAGHGYSFEQTPPYTPSLASVPVYPFFVAAVYTLAGPRNDAVRVAQAALDLLTCLLVSYVSFRLAPRGLKRGAAFAALAVYGLVSWFTLIWTSCLLTETLALFFTTLTLAFCARDPGGGRWRVWAAAGCACGLAVLTRPDSVLLAAAVLLFLAARLIRRRSRASIVTAAGFCLALALVLAPWTLRNFVTFGVFEPLASEYGCAAECYFPVGYLHWVRTWLGDEKHFDYAFEPAWPTGAHAFDAAGLPREAYDSEEERLRVVQLIERYDRARRIDPGLDADFRALAAERVRRAPVRFFVTLPLYRLASMWLTGFSTGRPTPYVMLLRVCSVLPLHLCAALGFALCLRGRALAWLLLSVVVVRSAFFGFHYAPETRYIVEAYPPVIAACGVAVAALWRYFGVRPRAPGGGAPSPDDATRPPALGSQTS